MITIRTFDNQAEAAFCVSLLQARGFDPVLLDEASHAWNSSGAAVPIRLQVPEEQASDAAAYLASARSEAAGSESTSDRTPTT
jgi:hypothetical protein